MLRARQINFLRNHLKWVLVSLVAEWNVEKIISGGQTGVDRAALDITLELSIPCGGWCHKGRQAEFKMIFWGKSKKPRLNGLGFLFEQE